MSILDSIVTTLPGAPRITIFGKPGIGKSTLASQFPRPLFVLTEDIELPGVQSLPISKSFNEIWGNIKAILALDEIPFDTIVIDSVSKLDALVVEYILDKEPPGKNGQTATLTAACGGYGAGFLKAQSLHRAFKGLMDKFKDRGIAVIYVAHVGVIKHKAPDSEDFDIYSIVMNHEKSREPYIDDTDAVIYCKLKSYTTTTDSGRTLVKSTQDRIIVAGINDGHVSKNRFNMPAEMPMTFEALSSYIPFYGVANDE